MLLVWNIYVLSFISSHFLSLLLVWFRCLKKANGNPHPKEWESDISPKKNSGCFSFGSFASFLEWNTATSESG